MSIVGITESIFNSADIRVEIIDIDDLPQEDMKELVAECQQMADCYFHEGRLEDSARFRNAVLGV